MRTRMYFISLFSLALLFLSFSTAPTEEIFSSIEKKLKNYLLKNTTEKVYLHTDKDVYQLGDTLWFKAYTTKFNNKRSLDNNLLTLTLYNNENKEVTQELYKLSYGLSNGSFVMPMHLDDGDYRLVAYTDFMHNVDSTNVFSKTIRIYENIPKFKIVLKHLNDYYSIGDSIDIELMAVTKDNQPLENIPVEISLSAGKRKYEKIEAQSSDKGKIKIKLQIPDKNYKDQLYIEAKSDYLNYNVNDKIKVPLKGKDYLFRFFPEGGDLIADVKNRIAFEAYDDFENQVHITGLLKNQHGQTIDTIRSTYPGLGSFYLNPISNQQYHIEIIEPYPNENKITLPQPKKSGIAISTDYQEEGTVSLDINASNDFKNNRVYGILYSGGEIHWSKEIDLKNFNQLIIPVKNISEGLAQLTLFNENYSPMAERLLYIPASNKLNIKIEADKDNYRPKEKVQLEIEVTDANGKPVSTNLSMAVVDEASIIPDNFNNIISYNLFEGELSENIPDHFLLSAKGVNYDYADLMLLTKGWRRFKWEKIIESDQLSPVYNKSKKFVGGYVKNYRGKPVKKANVQLFNPYQFKVKNTTTDQDGYFYFTANEYLSVSDTAEILITASRKNGKSNVNIYTDDNYSEKLKQHFNTDLFANKFSPAHGYESILTKQEREDYYKDFDAQSIFIDEVTVTAKKRVKIPEAVRRKKYNEIKIEGDKIYSMPSTASSGQGTFIDLLSKMTTNFRVTSDYKVLFRGYNSLIHQSGALIVLNGMPMGEDIRVLDDINASEIKEFRVVKNPDAAAKYYGGSLGGLIEVTLKDATDFQSGKPKNIYDNKINYKGMSVTREFYSPIYNSDQEKLVTYDIRNTLYWNPDLKTNNAGKATISFFTSDQKMNAKAIIEGMDFNQHSGRGETTFVVY